MPTPLALLALFALPFTHPGPARHSEVTHVAGWTLRAHEERFTGAMVCRISRPRIALERQALVFKLSRNIDTSGAVYRIDGGAPVWSPDDLPELARLGFALHNDDLDNPSGGLVRVPLRRLPATARVVDIETRADGRDNHFRIDGLADAIEAAKKAGCPAAPAP